MNLSLDTDTISLCLDTISFKLNIMIDSAKVYSLLLVMQTLLDFSLWQSQGHRVVRTLEFVESLSCKVA